VPYPRCDEDLLILSSCIPHASYPTPHASCPQIEDGSLSLELSVFDPRPLIEHSFQKYSVQAPSKDVTMSLSVELSYSNLVIDQQHCIRLLGQSLHHRDHYIISPSSPYHHTLSLPCHVIVPNHKCYHTIINMLSTFLSKGTSRRSLRCSRTCCRMRLSSLHATVRSKWEVGRYCTRCSY
jgi:hypothetical protein